MQLGISTYTYGWGVGVPGSWPVKPLMELDLLQKAQDFGLQVVQFGDNLPLHELSNHRLTELQQSAAKLGMAVEVGARGLTPEHLQRYILLAEKLNSCLIRFVTDAPGYEPDVRLIIQIIQNQLPVLEEKNITLGLENHDRLQARQLAEIVEQVNSPNIGICLDSVNSMGAGEGLEQIVNTLAPYTVNLHLKDFGIQRLPHLMGFQISGRPAGQGMLNVPWLLEKLALHGRCQTAVLEQWVVPEKELSETLRKEENWAVASVDYLRPYFKN